jgi:galactonate dehydratase
VIQPDVCHDGGIKETLKIAAMAETHDILVAPHNPNGPVATAASVHVAACVPNFLMLEYANSPTRDDCQTGGLMKAVGGRIELPTRPGLGVDLDEEYLSAHPWQGTRLWSGLHYADGGVANV